MWWQFCFKLVAMAKQSSFIWSSWNACEGWCYQNLFVAAPAGHPTLPAACLPFSASRVYIHFTHSESFHNHILIVSTLLERLPVLLWFFFFNVFSASLCLLITFGKFIHVKEHICVGMCVVMSLFKATDSFKPKNLHFFLQVTYCMCC